MNSTAHDMHHSINSDFITNMPWVSYPFNAISLRKSVSYFIFKHWHLFFLHKLSDKSPTTLPEKVNIYWEPNDISTQPLTVYHADMCLKHFNELSLLSDIYDKRPFNGFLYFIYKSICQYFCTYILISHQLEFYNRDRLN